MSGEPEPESVPRSASAHMMMPMFEPIKGVPLGLEPLAGIDSIYIQQELEIIEVLLDFETSNRYQVMNNFGTRMYFAGESSGCCARNCCGKDRPFTINLVNFTGQPVVTMTRTCNCRLCFWGASCAGSDIEVRSSLTGELYGSVIQNCSCCSPSYSVLDWDGNELMIIEGPCGSTFCPCLLCCDAMFSLYLNPGEATSMGIPEDSKQRLSEDMQERRRKPSEYTKDKILIGGILKKFKAVEFISDANSFGVQFSPELDPRLKAVLIGATFCIDFSFFESGNKSRNQGGESGCVITLPQCGPSCGCGCCCMFLLLILLTIVGVFVYAYYQRQAQQTG